MGCKWHSICPMKRFTEKGKLNHYWVDNYCIDEDGYSRCVRFIMEERGEYHPDNMLPDGTIDKSLVLL